MLAGLASAVFLVLLAWATRAFDTHDWLLYLLPVGGLAVGLAYHYGGGRSVEGNRFVGENGDAQAQNQPQGSAGKKAH